MLFRSMSKTLLVSAICLGLGLTLPALAQNSVTSTGGAGASATGANHAKVKLTSNAAADAAGSAAANNGGTATASVSDSFDSSKAVAVSSLDGTVTNIRVHGIGNVATNRFGTNGLSTDIAPEGNVQGLAALIFSQYLWAFELTSALLITAAIGAMILAHRERFEHRKTQRELSVERFRLGGHPTPLPSPGVFARHNAVDTAALLPDGSYSRLSVPQVLEPRTIEGLEVPTGGGSHGSNGSQNGAS